MQFTKDELAALLNGEKPLQLTGLDLSKANLIRAELSKVNLSGADLNGAFWMKPDCAMPT